MTNQPYAMTVALAVRDACQRQVDKHRPVNSLCISSIVTEALRLADRCIPCSQVVFDGVMKAIQVERHCTPTQDMEQALGLVNLSVPLHYTRWRHGGWYVIGVHYPGGACGCVSNHYPDKKWRIVCDDRRRALNEPGDMAFGSREAAARAEQVLAFQSWEAFVRTING